MDVPTPGPIPRIQRITREEFARDYESQNKPVIIENQFDWEALDLFRPEWFAETFGDREFNAVVKLPVKGAPGFHVVDGSLRKVTLSEFTKMMHESENPCYIRQSAVTNFPGCEKYFNFGDLVSLNGTESIANLWIGSKNTNSSLHFDEAGGLFVQVCGRKRVKLYPPEEAKNLYAFPDNVGTSRVDPYHPDLDKYPRFAKARGLEGVVNPGEFLFIPTTWWHQLRSLDPSISINCFYGKCSTASILKVVAATGLSSWFAVARDFFWLGLLHRKYETKLLAETPTGKHFYDLVAGALKRRLGVGS
ncbi:MAG: cupin-like domain-containing protein [Planctomycetota bacterium]